MDDEERIMMMSNRSCCDLTHHNHDHNNNNNNNDFENDNDDDNKEEVVVVDSTTTGPRTVVPSLSSSSSSLLYRTLKIQSTNRNSIQWNRHDPNNCFYISCPISSTTLWHIHDILLYCAMEHPIEEDDDEVVSSTDWNRYYYFYQQHCYYQYPHHPNSVHNPLIFQPPVTTTNNHHHYHHSNTVPMIGKNEVPIHQNYTKEMVVKTATETVSSSLYRPSPLSMRYQIRLIVMGQLLLTTTATAATNGNSKENYDRATLDTIPSLMKLFAPSSSSSSSSSLNGQPHVNEEVEEDNPIITIHAVITTKPNPTEEGVEVNGRTTTTTLSSSSSPPTLFGSTLQLPVSASNSLSQHIPSHHHRIVPEDEDDLLFYLDDDESDEDEEEENVHERRSSMVSLFHNDDDDDDDEDDGRSILEEIDEQEDEAARSTTPSGRVNHATVSSFQPDRQPLPPQVQAHPTTLEPNHHHHRPRRRRRRRRQNPNRNVPLGFDALRVTAGLSRDEITILRLYFNHDIDVWIQQHPLHNTYLLQSVLPTTSNSTTTTTTSTNNNNNSSSNSSSSNGSIDTLRLRRLQEEAWMNEQGPYSEFRYNINASFVPQPPPQQQQQSTRARTTAHHMTAHRGNTVDSMTSPLLALPLPPPLSSSPSVSTENFSNNGNHSSNDRRRDGRRRHWTSLTHAVRNQVTTTGSTDGGTTLSSLSTGGRSRQSGGTILPLHHQHHNNNTSNLHGNNSSNHHRNGMTMPASSLGSDRDFIYGFIFGSMVGSGMLLWIWIPNVSYKQKLGILFGYALHLTMNMIHKSFHGGGQYDDISPNVLSPDEMNYNHLQYSRNFLINDDTLQLGE
jgi:hypothetical protein